MTDVSRRKLLASGAAMLAGASVLKNVSAALAATPQAHGYTPVVTPNGTTMPYTMEGGVKVFRLVAEPVKREFTPGLVVNCWGYNGQTPGPTIEAVEGDRVRIYVTNKLPEQTSVHWHGFRIPNGMDGVGGLTQKHIQPGETYVYEFTLRQNGTLMYHPHSDEMTQMAMGMMGFFIIHPRENTAPVDRDFAIFLNEWDVKPGTATPNVFAMTDFNYFTFNSRVYPGTDPLVVRQGQRVRIRLANLSMDSHPIHLHGHIFDITGSVGGRLPQSAWFADATVNVPVGTTRDIEFVADNPGDWPFHCHKSHHAMNGMVHDLPNLIGVKQKDVAAEIQKVAPDYMPMGTTGMSEMDGMNMGAPPNTIPMGSTPGPFGYIEMGGMFTVLKVRPHITSYHDPGWYQAPPGTRSHLVGQKAAPMQMPMPMKKKP
ncbi:MAG: multicopper oxidase family protein [Candidatus Xenobia bacterium]